MPEQRSGWSRPWKPGQRQNIFGISNLCDILNGEGSWAPVSFVQSRHEFGGGSTRRRIVLCLIVLCPSKIFMLKSQKTLVMLTGKRNFVNVIKVMDLKIDRLS